MNCIATSRTTTTVEGEALFRRAEQVMPGGVSSPVRAFGGVGGTPFFIERGEGAFVHDNEGRKLLDFVGSWGPLVLGHARPEVVAAIAAAAARGTTYGAPCRSELALAEAVVAASPVAEKVRFVSSGTEATMSALRLARAATGRDIVVKFEGCYHGHHDAFLVKAGSGLATSGESSSQGVPGSWSQLTGVLPLDDEAALEEWFSRHGAGTAAVFVEGVPANCGLLPQRSEWLAALRRLTREHGSLLVVDEVITGFRLDEGGFCGREGYEADLVTYGKVIGGGLPVGAYAGPAALMDQVAPLGPVYQAGTLSGNPVAMAAGLATLEVLQREDASGRDGWAQLEHLGAEWEARMRPLVDRECGAGHPVAFTREGSLFWFCFGATDPPRRFDALPESGPQRYARFFHELLAHCVLLAPSAFEVGFLNLAMEERDLDAAAAAVDRALVAAR